MKLTLKNTLAITGAILVIAFVLASAIISEQTKTAFGSVSQGSEYKATTTRAASASATVSQQLCSSRGVIGSIVVNQPATAGYVRIWDATTTATSTIQSSAVSSSSPTMTLGIAGPQVTGASDVGGTYTYDMSTFAGVVIETSTGFDGEYTVTYRCN